MSDSTETNAPVIKRATIKDAESLSKLIRNAMASYKHDSGIAGDVLESMSESVESVARRIRNSRCLCIYDEENNPIGTITIRKINNPLKFSFSDKTESYLSRFPQVGYISRFAVDSKSRNTGLGVNLIEAALASPEAQETGVVLLHTAVANEKMDRFYHNSGFYLLDSESSRGYERGLFVWENNK